jgi:hypothetical protein
MKRASLAYAGFFLALFLQLPLRGSLPGNTDTLLAIALSNLSVERLRLFFSGLPAVTAFFPVTDVMAYGENCYGLVVLFEVFKQLTGGDVWGYYFFISALFTFNALAAFKLIGLLVGDELVAWCGGLAFSCLGFIFGSIDDPNVILLALPILSLYFLERALRSGDKRLFLWGLALSGVQIWFGFYVFLFQALVLVLFLAAHFRALSRMLGTKDLLNGASAYLLPAAPLLLLYFYNHFFADVFSPYSAELTTRHASLEWHNFRNVLPGNLLYSDAKNTLGSLDVGGWHTLRKNAFLGFAFPACALLGLWVAGRRLRFAIALFLVFFALSFGVHFPPVAAALKLPLAFYFRVPLRFLLVALIPAAVFFSFGLKEIRDRARKHGKRLAELVPAAITLLVLLENVPVRLTGFRLGELLVPPEAYTRFFSGFARPQVVLDVPSTCFYPRDGRANESALFWFYSRDILYMNWQSYHHQPILGGVNSYVPRSRAELDREIQAIPAPDALKKVREAGGSYIVFHKKMVIHEGEDVLEKMKHAPGLSLKLENDDIAIFEVSA